MWHHVSLISSNYNSCLAFLSFCFLKILFIYFLERGREGEREGEKHQCVVASCLPPTGDLARNPEPRLFSLYAVLSPQSHPGQGSCRKGQAGALALVAQLVRAASQCAEVAGLISCQGTHKRQPMGASMGGNNESVLLSLSPSASSVYNQYMKKI